MSSPAPSSSSSSAAAASGFTICQQLPEFPSVKELEGAAQAEQEGGGGGESGGEAAAAAAAAETCQQQQHQLPQLPNPPSAVASDKIQTLVRRSQCCSG